MLSVCDNMKKILLICALSIAATAAPAQPSPTDDAQTIELREKLGIDYSMPDFSTSKVDGDIIGTRLSRMLNVLLGNQKDHIYRGYLSLILNDIENGLRYVDIDGFKVKEISKQGDTICVTLTVKLGSNSSGIRVLDVPMTFTRGVSESQNVNVLFSELSKYARK